MGSKRITSKNDFYFTILGLLSQTTNLKKIQETLGISKQNLNYYLRKLRKDGLIRKISKGYYEVVKGIDHTKKSSKNFIRGHAFIWKVKLNRKYNWIERLEKLKISYSFVGNHIPRIIINNRKIWLTKKSILVYEPHSFYGENAIESKKFAVISLIETLEQLELKLNISLKPYYFKPLREHYGIIKNDLAVQCNRNGEKIHIRDDKEGEWLWIDDSLSLGELETGGKKALLRNIQVQKWWNDHKKYNFQVTPSFLMEQINQVTQNQLMFNKNFESHIEAIKKLGNSAEANAKTTELLAGVIKDLAEEVRLLKLEIEELKNGKEKGI